MSKERSETAAEFKARLEQDSNYRAIRARKEERFRKLSEKYAELERPLLDKLRLHGYEANSIVDLIKKYSPLSIPLVETLLVSIDDCTDDRIKEWIIRALAMAKQPFDGTKLSKLYDNTNNVQLKWVIANTVASSKPHSIDEWLEKAKQDSYLRTTLEQLGFCWKS